MVLRHLWHEPTGYLVCSNADQAPAVPSRTVNTFSKEQRGTVVISFFRRRYKNN